jgi:uncharacterized protein YbaP (TraB family)
MKRILLILICLCPYLLYAQAPIKKKKYPSLLWEITGNGLKKPSFLFGTMHVSSKMAFHLADSFYVGIHNADMVALETNPESWQEDMSKYDLGDNNQRFTYGMMSGYTSLPEDYLRLNTLKFYKYDKKIERTLYSSPSTINNLLYRSYGNKSSDFEEDTYLDMYIYQCGKKWGKKVAGVEKYGESMKLMAEAYKDAAKDKSKKERSYDVDDGYSSGKLQEAYRTGNLDWLDSINKYNSFSSAFDEKFLYRRNEIQAGSIDSILRTGQSLFVGVGAAHLPGNRGVIEILRQKGYKVRPVKMGERDSQHKNDVEKLRVPVVFNAQSADDGIYKVDIPGKFYKFGDDASLDQRQYADMANGSYYMVTRIMTNAWMWGHSTEIVSRTVDSLLYENIPGKIVTKTPIVKNGYKGFDIINKTRRGDMQRYNIFITPFEIIVFKMGGTGDYVKNGDEAKKFFGSIQLKEFNLPTPAATTGFSTTVAPAAVWKKYSPSYGGFAINLPHDPYVGNDGSWIFDAEDRAAHTQYRVIRTDIHNYHFAEEDTFDLNLMNESFASSEFIDKQIGKQFTTSKGYPALDVQYIDKAGNVYVTRFIIQGPHYYTLIAHGKQETPQMKIFLNSFEVKPFVYKESKERRDTSLYYSVNSPVFPGGGKEKIDMPRVDYFSDPDDTEADRLNSGVFRSKVISNDTTGEKIYVMFYRSQPYLYLKDSAQLENDKSFSLNGDTLWIIRSRKKYTWPDRTRGWETVVSDTGSSRILRTKTFYKDGTSYSLITESDTLTPPSDFVRSFYDSFKPADTLKPAASPFVKKTNVFFADFMSRDSTIHKRAVTGMPFVKFDSADLPQVKKAILSLNWSEKKYLDTKKSMIGKLDDIHTKAASDFLRDLYYAAGDTVEIQYTVLEKLLKQQTAYSYGIFRDIVTNEPPVITSSSNNNYMDMTFQRYNVDDGNFMDDLNDSLALTRTILPELLPLMNLDDYKRPMMELLGSMVDSNLVKPKDYETYFSKFFLEAKQELKKQAIAEKKKAIAAAEKEKEDNAGSSDSDDERDYGNEDLALYATLLLPFWDSKPNVQPVINQMLNSTDKRLKYSTYMLLMRHDRPYPDSMLNYFAGLDDYRYELYSDLEGAGKSAKFPVKFYDRIALAKSKLLEGKSYGAPDSIVFIDSLPATVKYKKGSVYFFKYKTKKDDAGWKLATVGLIPQNGQFEFEDLDDTPDFDDENFNAEGYEENQLYDFTAFSTAKFNDDKPAGPQLSKQLKKLLYSHRKSGKEFYSREDRESYDDETQGQQVAQDDDNN